MSKRQFTGATGCSAISVGAGNSYLQMGMLARIFANRTGSSPNPPQAKVVSSVTASDNREMIISGRVQNGVVIPDGSAPLPEGALVHISVLAPHVPDSTKQRVNLPLVVSARPESVALTNQKIGEIMDDEDAPRH